MAGWLIDCCITGGAVPCLPVFGSGGAPARGRFCGRAIRNTASSSQNTLPDAVSLSSALAVVCPRAVGHSVWRSSFGLPPKRSISVVDGALFHSRWTRASEKSSSLAAVASLRAWDLVAAVGGAIRNTGYRPIASSCADLMSPRQFASSPLAAESRSAPLPTSRDVVSIGGARRTASSPRSADARHSAARRAGLAPSRAKGFGSSDTSPDIFAHTSCSIGTNCPLRCE